MTYSNSVKISSALAIALAAMACANPVWAQSNNDNRAPEVPAGLDAPGGTNKVHFHVYALGVQIYRATPSATIPGTFVWTFVAPDALLYDADGNEVGSTLPAQPGKVIVAASLSARATPA